MNDEYDFLSLSQHDVSILERILSETRAFFRKHLKAISQELENIKSSEKSTSIESAIKKANKTRNRLEQLCLKFMGLELPRSSDLGAEELQNAIFQDEQQLSQVINTNFADTASFPPELEALKKLLQQASQRVTSISKGISEKASKNSSSGFIDAVDTLTSSKPLKQRASGSQHLKTRIEPTPFPTTDDALVKSPSPFTTPLPTASSKPVTPAPSLPPDPFGRSRIINKADLASNSTQSATISNSGKTAHTPIISISKNRKKILVVEDEANIRLLLTDLLEGMNLEVHVAGDGISALHAIKASKFDAIISDNEMPNMKGSELFKILRKQRPKLAKRFIFASATIGLEEYKFGCPMIKKPYNLDDLADLVTKVLAS